MSEYLKYNSDSMGEIRRILAECHGDFDAARAMIARSIRAHLQDGGQTELGKSYADGVRPGTFWTAELLDMIEDELDFAGFASGGLISNFNRAVDDALNSIKDGSSGGRR